ncbi:MAG: menaquinone-dependent protoporphyrinogen IX dehydrogenase [Gammaproteobacteria bacterium]|jgi:menaquinone-dependent protoporphyrinogen oxidase|nr:menaquinone-dependent protoporphyrinogen IX dehydrogenase [Gammaproteobacteria bacterium]
MSSILIIYSTTDGQTLKICQRLQSVMHSCGDTVTLVDINDAPGADLSAYDKIVIGASIRYGKHRPAVYSLIKNNQLLLASRPSAFFSVNVVARKPDKRQPDTNPYVRKFLRQISWKPKNVAVFAGRIDYQRYGFWDRNIIRLIMWITKGPTDPMANIEFTDWNQVEAFGRLISEL